MRRPYRRTMPKTWWLRQGPYRKFMIREWTAVFVVYFSLWTLCLVDRAKAGPDAFASFLQAMKWPWFVGLHGLGLLAVLYHTATWFQAAPKGLVVRLGEHRLNPGLIVAAQWVAFAVATLGFFLLVWPQPR
jgi:fumarate reductase subunit C